MPGSCMRNQETGEKEMRRSRGARGASYPKRSNNTVVPRAPPPRTPPRVPQPLVQRREDRRRAGARPVAGSRRGAGPGRRTAGGARSPGRAGSRGRPPRAGCPGALPGAQHRLVAVEERLVLLGDRARSHQRATASAVAANPRWSPRKSSTYGSRPQPLQGVPGLLVQARRGDPHARARPCRSRARRAGSAAGAACAAPTRGRRRRRAPSRRRSGGRAARRSAGRRRRAAGGRPATARTRPRPSAVRAGTSRPRRFSRDTDERTEGASTPTAPSSRISSATGTGPRGGRDGRTRRRG